MQNGAYHRPEEVAEYYNENGASQENPDTNIKPLNLTGHKLKVDIVTFLKSITGKTTDIKFSLLPTR